MEDMRVAFGRGGWVVIDGLDLPGPLYLRLRDQDGRLRICEFYLDASRSESPVDAQDLSTIPLTRIEASINSYFADNVREMLAYPAPDLSTLASYYSTGIGSRGAMVRALLRGNWVMACLASQNYIPVGKSHAELVAAGDLRAQLMRVSAQSSHEWQRVRQVERDFRLTEGPKDGLTNEFLTSVKRAYDAAVARGERPNASIRDQLGGEAKGVSLKTVQRWVYTARERGIMLRPAKPGVMG